ncbi:MAG: bifunctional ADP-heptose synthase [Prolixibacteraceae bacterium]|nr:bifunctional ADP-heptose synthase [Prolixibacteraceae bacterium]
MEKEKIDELLRKFGEITSIVIGDAMVDSYMWGKVDRVSPEAPIPIVSVANKENRLGGAANVSLNLQALGATPLLFSVIGDDEKGRRFRKLMEKHKLSTEGIFIDPFRITTVKSRIISSGQHIARIDEESTDFINSDLEIAIFNAIKRTVENKKINVIIFVDYDKGMITPKLIEKVMELAHQHKIPVAVDPKKRNFHVYDKVDLFKPNFKEFVEGTAQNIKKGDLKALKKAAENLKKEKSYKYIFVTLSELGVFLSNSVSQTYYPAEIRYIADVSGAGDTVLCVASLCLAAGVSPRLMALLSNIAGGLVCEKVGVVPIDHNIFVKELEKTNFPLDV